MSYETYIQRLKREYKEIQIKLESLKLDIDSYEYNVVTHKSNSKINI